MHISLIIGIAAVVCAALLSYVCTPLVRVLAFKIGALDVPKDDRRMHRVPIPRIGGLAIFIGFALTLLAFCQMSRFLTVALFGGLIIVVMGVLDDVFALNAWLKLAVQVAVAGFAVIEGVTIEFITLGDKMVQLGAWSIPLTMLWIVGLTNSINLIDGLDGLACGISTICSISLFVVMIILGDYTSALIVAVVIGACIGFFPFNTHPARIFMGDTGAQTLGYLLSIIAIQGVFKTHMVFSFIIPLSIFGLPIFDTLFAIIRRLVHGKSPFASDRGHIHHRLIDMGFGQRKSVRILYSICGILGIAAVLLTLEYYIPAALIFVSGMALFVISSFVYKSPSTRAFTAMFDEEDAIESGIKIATEKDFSNQVKNLAADAGKDGNDE
ncbi:MAG: undecaprenyl/decaprenyl-phosphate alpha-N-acetylglucosaminyl 1-phosphate transferase [Ruminococcaceae bacterium]|nr:undecaprenyl/decaprenyl-phosphate alpha-N-acetylglucosaminyl 1-phosphate transferase [Oscillospiraceae bacterium]